jgi:Domain of unknown function (DUF5005)
VVGQNKRKAIVAFRKADNLGMGGDTPSQSVRCDSTRNGFDPIKTAGLQMVRRISRFRLPVMLMAVLSCSVVEPKKQFALLSVTVSEDNSFNQLFKRCGPGWTGGDSTYSTALSPTQVMWLFSDTFIGPVSRNGKRDPDGELFVQGNTLVLQDKTSGTLTTYFRQSVGEEEEILGLPTFARSPYDASHCPGENFVERHNARAMFQPPHCLSGQHCYYWGGALVADNGQLTAFLQLMEQTGAGIFDFAWRGSAIATIPLKEIATAEPTYINAPNNGVSYGGAIISAQDNYTYIYGMREEPAENAICAGHCIHIARAPSNKLAQPQEWRYWGEKPGSAGHFDWIETAEKSMPMAGNTGSAAAPQTQDQLGAGKVAHCGALPECYVIIAHQYTGGTSENILAWYAAQPQGPWSGPVFVYQTPESRQPGKLFTYNAKIHPEFTTEDGLLVSYDVNSLAPATDPLSPLTTADSYRPRFIRVKLHWLAVGR